MYTQLPKLDTTKMLHFPHFPTTYQCVIFRNWGLVPVDRIAKVIGTDPYTVKAAAAAMGLDPEKPVHADWMTKGYITIIHYNWHILSYAAICTLLDWTEERLAYTLREDDFLEVKLGNFKPATPDCTYHPLTAAEAAETAKIRQTVLECQNKLPADSTAPFAFFRNFHRQSAPMVLSDPRYEERYLYSYCALYGDTFADRELIDASFPDALLAAYAANGITGIWSHIVLYTVVPYPFDETLSEGWEKRQAGMRYLTEKLSKYGLKLFFYFNEPRAMPEVFFQTHPELRGCTSADGAYSSLCMSVPAVQAYLKDSVAMLAKNIPLLGGFFTITASENQTNCYSHTPYGEKSTCPRCGQTMDHTDSYALVNRLIWEGVSSVSDTIRVIAWTWGWDPRNTPLAIEKMPKEVAIMNVSEQGVTKDIDGTTTSVLDYSLSIEGPGTCALSTWQKAHESGHHAYAKLQLNNTWEIAAVPCVPALEKVYRHMRRLAEAGEARPDGLMLSWTLGGYPSPTLRLVSYFYDQTRPIPTLSEIYADMFPHADIPALTEAIHQFSEAFDAYPFHISTAYAGPQLHAPANLLYPENSGFIATMTGFPYDNLDSWRGIFSVKTYITQLQKLSDGWHRGVELLRPIAEAAEASTDPTMQTLWHCAVVCDAHFRSMLLQCWFVCLRDDRSERELVPCTMAEILSEEEQISMRVAAVQAIDPTIGYESTNHYVYYQNNLFEKVIGCRYLAAHMDH